MSLNAKQEAFAKEVVRNGGNKVEAFKKSWSWENYSKAALDVQANKQYNHPKISLRIAELQTEKNKVAKEVFKIDAEYVLRRLKEIDDLDVLDIMKDDLSSFRKLSEWPKVWRTSISGLDLMVMNGSDDVEAIVKKIKWPDKTKNLEMIGRHVNVKAWEKEVQNNNVVHNIMPVPVADSVDSWEEAAKKQQEGLLGAK